MSRAARSTSPMTFAETSTRPMRLPKASRRRSTASSKRCDGSSHRAQVPAGLGARARSSGARSWPRRQQHSNRRLVHWISRRLPVGRDPGLRRQGLPMSRARSQLASGASTSWVCPGSYTWGSGRFAGVAADAAHLATQIQGRRESIHPATEIRVNELALGS